MPSQTSIRPLTDEEKRRIVSDYEAGVPVKAIAAEMGRSPTIVYHFARTSPLYGTIKQPRGFPLQTEPEERDLEMAELRKAGMTLQEIGDTYGITRERVRQRLAKFDIDLPAPERFRYHCDACDVDVLRKDVGEHRSRHVGIGPKGYTRLPETEMRYNAIADAYLRGDKIADISRTFRTRNGEPLPYPTLYRILRTQGIDPERGGGHYKRDAVSRGRFKESMRKRRETGIKIESGGWRAAE